MNMQQQHYYNFLQKQIYILIGLSLLPGLVYVFFGWVFDILYPALFWYISLLIISMYGALLYHKFNTIKMNKSELKRWYMHLNIFMYIIFSSWAVIFVLYIQHSEVNLHYIAIFTELGAAVVASTLLVSDKKLFVPILITLMLPLSLYFLLIGTWFGYVLCVFSLIFLGVLLYGAYNTNNLIAKNYHQAQHDMLTGLYNRRYFMEYMEPLYQRLVEQKKIAYMLLIDLDHFKTINDSLGHEIGDKLLVSVAKRLEACSKEKYMLARLGGDEFILVSYELEKTKEMQKEAYHFALQILEEIRRPYTIDTHHLHISASIGLHELANFSLNSSNFIKEVDIAMYEAKSQGRDGVIVFNKDLSERVERHLEIEQRLHQSLNANRLKVYYQPQFNSQKQIVGCEALVRWFDDDLGALSADEFIPIAENTGLIIELGSYVLHETFNVLHTWNEEGHCLQKFAINISIRQLLYEPFMKEVEVLTQYYFAKQDIAQKIIFEITEHVFSEDMQKVVKTMKRLQKCGITFAIDDFGTGYSSLSYLQELPIGEVKIDKAFIADMGGNGNSEKMIETIISIAKNFNLEIVSEGVEEEAQFEALQAYDCDIFQGFYFDEALSKEAFEQKYFKG